MGRFEVCSVTGAPLQRLYQQHMTRDFPPSERKPLSMLEEAYRALCRAMLHPEWFRRNVAPYRVEL